MFPTIRGQGVAVLLTLLTAGTCQAQLALGPPIEPAPASCDAAAAPPRPAPVCQPLWHLDPVALYASAYASGGHAHGCSDGPPPCAPYEDRNGPLLVGDPLADNLPGTPGWVLGVELAGIVPHVENKLFSGVTLTNGVTGTVALPAADIGARVMPRIELGYRFGQASGELLLSYHFVVGDGMQFYFAPLFAPTGAQLRSRLDVQVLDVDYGSYERSLGPQWDMKWRVGLRGIIYYADSQAASAFDFQQETNRYWGIGPHAVLDLRYWCGDTGLAMFGRAEVAMVWGRLAQRYIEIAPPAAGEARFFENQQAVALGFQGGATWSPQRSEHFRLTAGYIWEHYIDIGALFTGISPRETLTINGGFLRAEWNY
jgi:hypothetical protein